MDILSRQRTKRQNDGQNLAFLLNMAKPLERPKTDG
jgi:hypothetical protein